MTDDEIAAQATEILRSRGRGDCVRRTQVATYRRVLDEHGLPDFIGALTEGERRDIATLGWRALGEKGREVDEQFVDWAHAREFPFTSHIWIKGFLATYLAISQAR
jgi:hypothetical protein